MNSRVYYTRSTSPDMNYMGYESDDAKFPKSTMDFPIEHGIFGAIPYDPPSPFTPHPTLHNDGRRTDAFDGIAMFDQNPDPDHVNKYIRNDLPSNIDTFSFHAQRHLDIKDNNYSVEPDLWTIHEFDVYKQKMSESYNCQIKETNTKFEEYENQVVFQVRSYREKIKELIVSKYKENMQRMEKIRQKNFGHPTKQKVTKIINKKVFHYPQNNNKILADIPMKSCSNFQHVYASNNVSFNGQDYVVFVDNKAKASNCNPSQKKKPQTALFEAFRLMEEPGFSPTVSPDPVALNKYASALTKTKTIHKSKKNRPKRVFCQQTSEFKASTNNSYQHVPKFNVPIPLNKSINTQQPTKANPAPLYAFHPHTPNNCNPQSLFPPNVSLQYPSYCPPNTISKPWCPPNVQHPLAQISVPIGVATQAPMQYTSSDPSMSADIDPNNNQSIIIPAANSVNFASISSKHDSIANKMTSPDTASSSDGPSMDAIPPPITSTQIHKKRGRGRPRKDGVIKPAKRGRGRPRKIQSKNANALSAKPKKRGRGRPRKVAVAINSADKPSGKQKKSVMRQVSDKLNSIKVQRKTINVQRHNNYLPDKKMRFNVIITNHTSCSPQRKNRIKNLQCHHCGKFFATNYELTRHLRIHTGERPYICPICLKGFKQKQHMITHKKSVHDNYRPFKCDICQKQFKEKGTLTKHIQYTHKITQNTLSCRFCDKSFKRKGNLKSHLKRVHSQDN